MDTGVIGAAHALADAASRWRNADFPPRVRTTRALRERTGYTEPVVDYALDVLFAEIDGETILATIANELGDLAALETFVSRAHLPDVTYAPLARAAIVSSDTTIGVALAPLVFALCAGCRVDVKDRDDRLIAEFLATLAQEAPELAARATAATWRGDDDNAARTHLADVDVAIAYGSDTTLARIRAALAPHARFVGFGHRTSLGYVARESLATVALAREAARAAARDALLYDGEGCLSTHALLVETGGAIAQTEFVRFLASACDEIAIEFPAGFDALDPSVAAYVRAARFRASQGEGAVYVGTHAPHVVVFEASPATPPPLLRRTLACYAIAGPTDALAFVHRHALPLEGIAFSGDATGRMRADLLALARGSGAARIAALGELQRPPLGGEHGGHGRIRPFVRAIYRE